MIRQNVVFSLVVKVMFVVATFSGFATLWGAIAADVVVSLLVVGNALRLLHPGSRAMLSRERVDRIVESITVG